MPSTAAEKFYEGLGRASFLRETASIRQLYRTPNQQRQIYYHASLASSVAAWDAYINNIINEFFSVTTKAIQPDYHAIHTIAQQSAQAALSRFNTPNWENSRNIVLLYTGFDPISYWVWPSRGLSSPQVQERLNQILKVRHSFAHGFQLPVYEWTRSPAGKVRLTAEALKYNERFISHLVRSTDKGLKHHIKTQFDVLVLW